MFPTDILGWKGFPPRISVGNHELEGSSMRKHLRFLALALSASLTLSTTIMAVSPSFSDVPTTHWAYTEITEAVNHGITNGYADGTFHTTASNTNGLFSAFLARTFYKGLYDD